MSGDGEVVKRVIEEGKGWKSPKEGEKVTVTYKGACLLWRVRARELEHHAGQDV